MIKEATQQVTRQFQSQIEELSTKIPPMIESQKFAESQPISREISARKKYGIQSPYDLQIPYDLNDDDVDYGDGSSKPARFQRGTDKHTRQYNKIERKLDNLTKMFGNLDLRDTEDMDISNLVRGEEITSIPVKPENDDEYTIQLVRKKKLQRSG